MTENLVSDIGIELTMAFVTCAARSSDSSPQSNFLKFLKTAIEETLTIEANWLSLEHNFNGWSTHRIGNLKANRCIDRDGRESFVVEILPAVSNRLCHGYGTKPAVSQTDLRNKNSPPLSHPNPKVICPLIQTSSSVTHDLIYHLRFKIWHVLLGMTRKNTDISAEFWTFSICVSAPWCLFTHIWYIYHKSKTLIRPLPKILVKLILWQPRCYNGRVSCHSFWKKYLSKSGKHQSCMYGERK